jgi:DNA-binding MarR family transcriptional regulator
MTRQLAEQAAQLHRVATDLVMKYQFRDRNDLLCYGVTVSQCYTLEALEHGPLTMKELAERLHVAVSTMTRIVDRLVARQLVARHGVAQDRRVCQIRLTDSGVQLLHKVQGELIARNQEILERLPEDARDHVIWVIEQLSYAVDDWRYKHRTFE